MKKIIRNLFNKHHFLYCLENLIKATQKLTGTFITYHQRPNQSDSILTSSQSRRPFPKLAIVIQGPIITRNAFTFETIKLYKKHFPTAFIILSTWSDEKQNEVSLIESLGAYVLLNNKPEYYGVSNINLQITSSKAGVIKAKELGAEYVLKTRTDQRIYSPNIEEYLYNILKVFPLNVFGTKQNKRIVGISMNTFKFRMYGLSDMFTYGHIHDMILFWDVELDNRKYSKKELAEATVSMRKFAQSRVCEVYLTTQFLIKIGRNLEWTLEDSWRVFADHFCIIDKESLDLFWGKYGLSEFRWKKYEKQINVFDEMNFMDWLNLFCNKTDLFANEEILDLPME
jgi:hypothetical protein